MSPHDIIEVPWEPGMYGRRVLVEALERAGKPPLNSVGRLKAKQQEFWDAYRNGTGSPADDPNRPNLFRLAHVRFAAADIDPTPERIRKLTAAGLVRPYSYEPWHWELKNIFAYPLVESLPTVAAVDASPLLTEQDNLMRIFNVLGAFYIAFPDGLVHIRKPTELALLRSFLYSGEGTEPRFNAAQRDLINYYLRAPRLTWSDLNE